jgi:hypothetical protein
MFTRSELDQIVAHDQGPAVSIFLPTHRAGVPVRQDPIRLKNLKAQAVERLVAGGMRQPDALGLLEPVQRLVEDEGYWRGREDGLALFVAPGFFREVSVPAPLPEKVAIGPDFEVMPLLPLLGADRPFLVLAVSSRDARLYEAGRHGMRPVEGLQVPKGTEQLAAETDYEQHRHASGAGGRPRQPRAAQGVVSKHNFGEDPDELRKALLVEYLHRVARGVDEWVGTRHLPIVVAALDETRGNLMALGRFAPDPAAEAIELDVNPDALDEAELHRRAYEAMGPLLSAALEREVDRFYSLYNDGSPRSTDRIEGIVRAARFQAVDVLLVPEDQGPVWGRFDEAADRVEVREAPAEGDEDLLARAARDALRAGGQVVMVPRDRLRPGSRSMPAGAILRFDMTPSPRGA